MSEVETKTEAEDFTDELRDEALDREERGGKKASHGGSLTGCLDG